MRRVIQILLIFFLGTFLCGCTQTKQLVELKISNIFELLEKNNIKLEECYLDYYFNGTDIRFDIKTKQIERMYLQFVVYKKNSSKYDTFTLDYEGNKLSLTIKVIQVQN